MIMSIASSAFSITSIPEAAPEVFSKKKGFLKISQISQENICVGVSLIKFCGSLYFEEYLQAIVSGNRGGVFRISVLQK